MCRYYFLLNYLKTRNKLYKFLIIQEFIKFNKKLIINSYSK